MDQVLSDPPVHHSSLPWLCSHLDPVYCNSCVRPGGQGDGAASGTKGRTELLFHLSRAWPCGCSGQGRSPRPPVGLGPQPGRGSVHTRSVWTDPACLRQAGARRWLLAKTGAASAVQPVSQRLTWCLQGLHIFCQSHCALDLARPWFLRDVCGYEFECQLEKKKR